MASLDDLGKSITEMSFDEAASIIKAIRLSRRTPKKVTKTRASKSKVQTKASTESLLSRLTPEQKAKLLEDLIR